MDLQIFMDERELSGNGMADLIAKKTGKRYSGAAVLNWAAGRRMPEPPTVEHIRIATDGLVTVADLHRTCWDNWKKQGGSEAARAEIAGQVAE